MMNWLTFCLFLIVILYELYSEKSRNYTGQNIFLNFRKSFFIFIYNVGELTKIIILFTLTFLLLNTGMILYENIPMVKKEIEKQEVKDEISSKIAYNDGFLSAYQKKYKNIQECEKLNNGDEYGWYGYENYIACKDFVLGKTKYINYDTGLSLSEDMELNSKKSCNYFQKKSEGYEACINYVKGTIEDKQEKIYLWFKKNGSSFDKDNLQINWGKSVTKDDIEYLKEGNNYDLLIQKLISENK